ncbi:MAG: phage tail tape measure protein [Candidatus Competibacter denitrificans]
MASGNRNLVLQLLLTAKDEMSSIIGKVFGFLDKTTSASANFVREKLGNLFGGGTQSAQDFEAALARVKAKADATDAQMVQLKAAAQAAAIDLKLGADGASKAAQALEFLTGAGLSVKQAISALPTVLRISTNEQISAKDAAEALTDVMSVMGIAFDQSGRAADILQKAADTTKTSVTALADGL